MQALTGFRNYGRGHLLGEYLGRACTVLGTMQEWRQEGEKVYLLLINVIVLGGRGDFNVPLDHLWVILNMEGFQAYRTRTKAIRLDDVAFNGRLHEYQRRNGSYDIGVQYSREVRCLRDFLRWAAEMAVTGRWQSILDMLDSDLIVLSPADILVGGKSWPQKRLDGIRELCNLNLAKLAQSKRGNKPERISLEIPTTTTKRGRGFG
jgi:hypothetical protein